MLEWPSASMPNLIRVPGITIGPAKQLPKQLEAIMQSSTNGVVLVSFGSLANDCPEDITDKLIDAFNQVGAGTLERLWNP